MRQVLLTGASSDIGLAVARQYVRAGYRVVGFRNSTPVEADEELAGTMTTVRCDFSEPGFLDRLEPAERDLLSRSDVLIHAAASTFPSSFLELSTAMVSQAVQINYLSYLELLRITVPGMIDRGWGRVVCLGSIGVKFAGGSRNFAYSLTKHMLEFFPSDHRQWAASNVLVNTLRVGVTDTRHHRNKSAEEMRRRIDLIPAGRAATPSEIADAVYYYGSDQNRYTTGAVIPVSGGE